MKQRILQWGIVLAMMVLAASAYAKQTDAEVTSQVNINTATAVELAYLPGIGPKTAERIIQYRTKQPFKQKHHLKRVRGIGYKMIQKLKPYILVNGQTTATAKIVVPRE